jgi:hypothetical protein
MKRLQGLEGSTQAQSASVSLQGEGYEAAGPGHANPAASLGPP